MEKLLNGLTDKGVKEKVLLTNIKKIFKKKLSVITKEQEEQEKIANKDKMNIDITCKNINGETGEIPITEEHIQNMLEWKNEFNFKKNKQQNQGNNINFEYVSTYILNIEEKITEYLKQNDKEWEFPDIRANFVSYYLKYRKLL